MPTLPHPSEKIPDDAFFLGAVGKLWAAGVPVEPPPSIVRRFRCTPATPSFRLGSRSRWITTLSSASLNFLGAAGSGVQAADALPIGARRGQSRRRFRNPRLRRRAALRSRTAAAHELLHRNRAVDQPAASVPSCEAITKEVFNGLGGCTGKACHNSGPHSYGGVDLIPAAPYALRLDSAAALQQTAIDRIAHETELGDESGGVPAENSPRFGVRMPLIDSSSGGPGNKTSCTSSS